MGCYFCLPLSNVSYSLTTAAEATSTKYEASAAQVEVLLQDLRCSQQDGQLLRVKAEEMDAEIKALTVK